LYIGSIFSAADFSKCKEENIKHIISCVGSSNFINKNDPLYNDYRHFDFESLDQPYYKIIELHCIDGVYPYLDEIKSKQEKVLVHCMAGQNRSVCIVVGYLIYQGMKLLEAVNLVAKKRNKLRILWNQGFVEQLIDYAATIGGINHCDFSSE